jgi:hypothetical protein
MRRSPAASGQRAASIQICVVLFVVLASAVRSPLARAEAMDPVLSRLRIVSTLRGCRSQDPDHVCKNSEQFERLVSELGVALAPPLVSPAASFGPSGLALAIDTTVTSIDANGAQWRNGVHGDPDPVLVWTHATLRKGLPFGLEVGANIGRGHATSLWSLGLSVKWAIIEGFRTGVGVLPDVALQASTTRSMGLDDLTLATHSVDLLLSKPLNVGRGYRIAPMLGTQLLFLEVDSGLVDLTPGPDPSARPAQSVGAVDAFESCEPGAPAAGQGAPLMCQNKGVDFGNNVQFDPISQTRLRLFIGGQLQYDIWRFSSSLGVDLLTPELEATRIDASNEPTLGRQVAFSISAGAVL